MRKQASTRGNVGWCRGLLTAIIVVGFAVWPATSRADASPPSGAYVPADLQSAYDIDTSQVVNVTVAVVAAFGYPNIESDLATYRSQFSLSPCTLDSGCLTVLNQSGQMSPLPPVGSGQDGAGWMVQTALALDMVSATCPSCKLLVVEANEDSHDDLILAHVAAANTGAKVIIETFGWDFDPTMDTAADAELDVPGVSVLASSQNGYDDMGAGSLFPATSQFVIGVSQTVLTKNGSTRGWGETASTLGGSACNTSIAKPSFQQAIATQCAGRAASDIAAVGDTSTPVAIFVAGQGDWMGVATGAVMIAGGILAQSGHAGVGPDFFYTHASSLHDVTSGSDGTCASGATILCRASTGWDGPTGNGTLDERALEAIPPPDAGTDAGGATSQDGGMDGTIGAGADAAGTLEDAGFSGLADGSAAAGVDATSLGADGDTSAAPDAGPLDATLQDAAIMETVDAEGASIDAGSGVAAHDAAASVDAGESVADSAASAHADAQTSDSGSSPGELADSGGSTIETPAAASSSGCSCKLAAPGGTGASPGLLAVAAAVFALGRRRRRHAAVPCGGGARDSG
jgi:MYXO-CTERM domain-containing protein